MHLGINTRTNRGAVLLLLALIPALTIGGELETEKVVASWVQYTTDGIQVRAVVAGRCPSIGFDGELTRMKERASPTDSHPNSVCVAEVPEGTRTIDLSGSKLPAPPTNKPKRIVVMGDTGCRVSVKHGLYQACNNSSIWPFPQVAASVAAYAPDLIIYTGDYIYRESACPAGNKGCADTPFGDNQATWEADWLLPAKPVHNAAPLVLIRGNHETCNRAGNGWFRYLDPRPYPDKCLPTTEPWFMDAGPLKIAILDTGTLKDTDGQPLTKLYSDQLRKLHNILNTDGWIATHRPFWGVGADDDTAQRIEPTKILQDAMRSAGLPLHARLMIGAHLHLAEVLDFGNRRPPQLVVGNGGTQLVPRVSLSTEIDGAAIKTLRMIYQYGFVTMEPTEHGGWTIIFRDVDGRAIENCRFDGKNVACPATG